MSQTFTWAAGSVSMTFDYADDDYVAMRSVSMGRAEAVFEHRVPIMEIMTTNTGNRLACNKLTHTVVGAALRYVRHSETVNSQRHELAIVLADPLEASRLPRVTRSAIMPDGTR